MGRPRVRAACAALATALACAGCGFGPGPGSGAVSIRVTADFGSRTLRTIDAGKVAGQETDMQLLEHHATVKTKYGGGFVESIDGHSGTSHHYDWFYFVNGVQPTKGAAGIDVKRGDHVWWDLHDWQAAQTTPAVVGSFPEPFLHGAFGKRYPSTIECSPGTTASCNEIIGEFAHFHIPLSKAGVGYGSGTDTLSVNLGTWDQLNGEVVGGLIAKGPDASGVYAHFTDDGHRLALENESGHVVRTLGPGAGLIAATAGPSDVPTWVVAGTDAAGVAAAARALTPARLADHFALAVKAGHDYPVPVVSSP